MSSQKWFITGASGGLGLALTEKVLAQGHRVVAAVRRIEGMRALKQAYPDLLEVEPVDVQRLSHEGTSQKCRRRPALRQRFSRRMRAQRFCPDILACPKCSS